jgi:hypothetical protein
MRIPSVLMNVVMWRHCTFDSYIFDVAKFVSRHPNLGQNQNIRIANESFEDVAKFRYLEATLTNQNDIQDEIESKLDSGNACYYSVQNLVSSRLISKNLKIKI